MKYHALLVVLMLVYAVPASADGDKEVFRCDSGCTVITCDTDVCTVYECENGSCEEIGHYPNPDSGSGSSASSSVTAENPDDVGNGLTKQGEAITPIYGAGGGLNCAQNRCVIKTCSSLECSLVGFDSGEIFLLGTANNDDTVFESIAKDFKNGNRASSDSHNR